MNKIYADSEEKYVKSVVLYADADDGNLFYDEGKKEGVSREDLINLFLKGLVISFESEMLKPIALKDNTTDAMVTALHESGSVTALSFYSAEHGA